MSERPDMLRDWKPLPDEVIKFNHDLCDYLEALCRDCTDGPMELEFDGYGYNVLKDDYILATTYVVDMHANARLFTLAKPVILSLLRVVRHQLKFFGKVKS